MNVHAAPQLTPAESALVAAFGERVSLLPGDGAVAVKRDNAIEQIKSGLPAKRIESWHYTDLRRLLTAVPAFDETAKATAVAPVLQDAAVLAVLNGVATAKTETVEGVTVDRVADKLTDPLKGAAEAKGMKLGDLMQPIRVALTGSTVSEPVNELLAVVGRENALKTLEEWASK